MPAAAADGFSGLARWYENLLLQEASPETLGPVLETLPCPCPAHWPPDFLLWLILKTYSVWPDCPELCTLFDPATRPRLLQQLGLIAHMPESTPAARRRLLTALTEFLPALQTEEAVELWAELAVALSVNAGEAAAETLWLALQAQALQTRSSKRLWVTLRYLLCNTRQHWQPLLRRWQRKLPRQRERLAQALESCIYDLSWLTLGTFQLQPDLQPLRPGLDTLVQLLWQQLQRLSTAEDPAAAVGYVYPAELQQRLLSQAISWELPSVSACLADLDYALPLDWLIDHYQLWEHQDLLASLTATDISRLASALPDPQGAEPAGINLRWQLLACLAYQNLPRPAAEAAALAPLRTRSLNKRWRRLQADLARLNTELGTCRQPQAAALFYGLQALQDQLQPLLTLEQALAEDPCPFWDWLQARIRPAALAAMDAQAQKYWLQALRGLLHLNLPPASHFRLHLAEAHLLARAGRSAWPALKPCLAHLHQQLLAASDGLDFLQDFSRLAWDLSQPVFDAALRQRVFGQLARWIVLADPIWHDSLWQNLVHMLARAGEMTAALALLRQVQQPQERLAILAGIPAVLSEAGDRTLYPAYLEALSALANVLPDQAVALRCQAAWAWALRAEPQRGLKVLRLVC